jgi:hypothetical protein
LIGSWWSLLLLSFGVARFRIGVSTVIAGHSQGRQVGIACLLGNNRISSS